jgi:NodT family efflux transporter outer membrane factor (OMF) lipoprotein
MSSAKFKWVIVGTFLLSGCASYSGITTHATLLIPKSQAKPADVFPAQHWWSGFSDPQLDRLIVQTLANNYSLKVVQSRIAGAQALQFSADSARYPQINAGAQSTREHLSANSIYPPPLGGSTVIMSSTSLTAGWQIDWFGRQRAALDAAIGQVRAEEADMQAAKVVLAASVATQYFNLARLQEQQQIKQQLLQLSLRHAELISQRVTAGLDNTLLQKQTEAEPAKLRRDLASVTEQIDIARHGLAVLMGAEPAETQNLLARLPDQGEFNLPDSLPASLLGHRADVTAARWRVESQLQGVKAARADFYPNINLTAFAGFESIGLSQWLKMDSRTMGAGPALSLPVFDAGRLRAQLQGKTAQADGAIETYNATVLNALREVADSLSSRQAVQAQVQQQQRVMTQLNGVLELAKQRYLAGLTNYFGVLAANEAFLQQQALLTDLQLRALDVEVVLMLALGGGYTAPVM